MTQVMKVIKIIDEYQIVINAGTNNGVYTNDSLEVFSVGEEIKDPDTGIVLGTLDTIKAKLIVSHAYEGMAICENANKRTISLINSMIGATQSTSDIPLNVDTAQISGGLTNNDKKIKIGDLVRKSLDDFSSD